MGENVLGKGLPCQAAAGDPLRQEQDAQRCQWREEQPQPMQGKRRMFFCVHREKFLSLPEIRFSSRSGKALPLTVLYYNPIFCKIKP